MNGPPLASILARWSPFRETPEQRAARLVQDAWSASQHAPAILAGAERPVTSESGYEADEATEYIRVCGKAWRQAAGAVEWLNKLVAVLPRKPRVGGVKVTEARRYAA